MVAALVSCPIMNIWMGIPVEYMMGNETDNKGLCLLARIFPGNNQIHEEIPTFLRVDCHTDFTYRFVFHPRPKPIVKQWIWSLCPEFNERFIRRRDWFRYRIDYFFTK